MNEQLNGIHDAVLTRATAGMATAAADLLQARARKMAQEKPTAGTDGSTIEVLEFGLADETYALELTYVREVGALVEVTPLPGVPDFVLGITCLHGQIIAVVDLRKLFGLPERGLRDSRQVIVLQSAGWEFGILAERVTGVKWLPLAGLQLTLPTLTDVRAAYLSGIAPDGTVFLSAGKLLADPRLVVRQEI
ncbi:MAG: chemotaxis protein CheW [Chloroflexi bacterium]|nr:chemotaxis protein CheW [Chloroflexota bacterium]